MKVNKKALLYAILLTMATFAFVGIMVYLFVTFPMLMVTLLFLSLLGIPISGLYELIKQLDR